jgi:3-hydroxymyristoyl/3-hydroxydecanoyl-(acyl carrier protein) dehydratase
MAAQVTLNPLREQIRSMLRLEPRDPNAQKFRAHFTVAPDLLILTDHFSHGPILPGICMIQAILLAAAAHLGCDDMRLITLKNAKMMQPVIPGDTALIDVEITPTADARFALKAKLTVNNQKRAEFSLVACAFAEVAP